jgi:hypothetical protein
MPSTQLFINGIWTGAIAGGEESRRTYGRVIPPRAEGIYQLVVKEPVGPRRLRLT